MPEGVRQDEGVYDAVIVGGGPSGSTVAALLARAGWRCRVVERARMPRFAIGESLLPTVNEVLRESGVWPKVEAGGFVRKTGAQFQNADGSAWMRCDFSKVWEPTDKATYQVERARFDQILIEHAGELGAEISMGCEAVTAKAEADGWELLLRADAGSEERVRARFVLDASGRRAWLSRQLGVTRQELARPPRLAVYAHVAPRSAPEVRGDPGDIVITRLGAGWSWLIPLGDARASVGVVVSREAYPRGIAPETFLRQRLRQIPVLRPSLEEAPFLSEAMVTADYSYASARLAGPRHVLLGDAGAFLDPIFSSGVCLGLESARTAAEMLIAVTPEGTLSARRQRQYARNVRMRVEAMRKLVALFYDEAGFAVLMAPRERFRLFSAVTTVVAGRTDLDWALRWRLALVAGLGKLNRVLPVAPPVRLA